MLNQIALIANKHSGALAHVVEKPCVRVDGCFNKTEFEAAVTPVLKMMYLDLVIVDATCVKDNFLDSLCYLKLNLPKAVRIIVLYPNLKDEAVLRQIYVYGIYDVVRPEIDEASMDDAAISKQISAEIQWAIQEPTSFAKVADQLAISVITQNVSIKSDAQPVKVKNKTELKKQTNKPRLIGFYAIDDSAYGALIDSNKYNVVDVVMASEDIIAEQDYSAIDIIALDRVTPDLVAYIKSLVDVNQNKAVIVAGYTDADDVAAVESIENVNVFNFDGSPAAFNRQVSINSVAKTSASNNFVCRTFGVYGAKGGSGATTITAVLAKEYAKANPKKKVLAVDFSAKAGDLGQKFGIALTTENAGNLYECVSSFAKAKIDHLDIDLLKDKVLEYCHFDNKSNVYVLPTSYTDIYHYTNYRIGTEDIAFVYGYILDTLKEYFDAIFIDITKYGGFPYELALDSTDKLIIVGDAKLASVSQMLTKVDELLELRLLDKATFIVNRSNIKHNEDEYDNYKVLSDRVGRHKTLLLPVDKKLLIEKDEMGTVSGSGFTKALNKIWNLTESLPIKKKKRGLLF